MPKTASHYQELPEVCPKCQPVEAPTKGKTKTRAAKEKAKQDAKDSGKNLWVECESCQNWYHWLCVRENTKDALDTIDKWYCTPCLESVPSLKITYRNAPRKSARNAGMPQINYSNLNQGIESDPSRWMRLMESSANGRRNVIETEKLPKSWKWETGEGLEEWIWGGGFKEKGKVAANGVEEEGLEKEPNEDGLTHPIVIRKGLEGTGLVLPKDLTVRKVAELVGPDTPVEVIDVASQTGLKDWTVGRWAQYYNDSRPRDKIRNVISLEVSESPLGEQIDMPDVVRKLDWVTNLWPKDRMGKNEYPKVQKYCLMSVSHCWTDWHIDFAGSSVFYHIIRGSKVFYFIRPTSENLRKFEKWSASSEQQENNWLGGEVDKVYKLELPQGSTALIPTGWIHAVYTPSDSLVIGGNFLHSLNIPIQMRVYDIEVTTKVPKKFRFPQYERLCWYVALSYATRLGGRKQVDPPPPLPEDITVRVLKGLKSVAKFLFEQVRRLDGKKATDVSANERRVARESVPHDKLSEEGMKPEEFVHHFKELVVEALGDQDDGDDVVEKGRRSVSTVDLAGKRGGSVVSEVASKKRRLSVVDDEEAAGRAKKKVAKGRKETEVISKETTHPETSENMEMRVDPGREEDGEKMAKVSVHVTNNIVTKRTEDEYGNVMVEKRKVTVTTEKVFWTKDVKAASSTTRNLNGNVHREGDDISVVQLQEEGGDIPVDIPHINGSNGYSLEQDILAFLPDSVKMEM